MDIDGSSPTPGDAGDKATKTRHGHGNTSPDATDPASGDPGNARPSSTGRTAAVSLAATCAAAFVALVVVAAVVPPPDRLARGLLVVVALVLLVGVSIGWLRTVRLLAERPR